MNRFKFTIVGESELTDDEIAYILQDEMRKLETLLNGEIDSQDEYTCVFHRGSIWFSGSFCSRAERKEE